MKNEVLYLRMDKTMKDKVKKMKKDYGFSDIQKLLEYLIEIHEKSELNPTQLTILDKIHLRQNELDQKIMQLSERIEKLTEVLEHSIIAYKGITALKLRE